MVLPGGSFVLMTYSLHSSSRSEHCRLQGCSRPLSTISHRPVPTPRISRVNSAALLSTPATRLGRCGLRPLNVKRGQISRSRRAGVTAPRATARRELCSHRE